MSESAPGPGRAYGSSNPAAILRNVWDNASMVFVFLGVFAIASVTVPYFLSLTNMKFLALAVSMVGMVACTMLFCLASGHFDLSVETVVLLSGVLAAIVTNKTGSVLAGVAMGVGAGGLVGLVNGLVIAKLKINALITTLATMQIVKGLAFIAADGKAVGVANEDFPILGTSSLAGIPTPVWLTVACFVLFGLLLRYTTFGRNTMAIGGNEEASRLAGIAVDRVKILIFVIQGVVAAFAGVVLASRMTSGQVNAMEGFSLAVISACVLGGVSLSGGVGTILGTLAGVLIMGTVENVMNLKNVDSFWQYVIRGAILLAAVLFDRLRQRRRGRQ